MTTSPWKQYQENEEINAHSENLVLMAAHVGDDIDKRRADNVLWRVHHMGYRDWIAECDARKLNARLYPMFSERFRHSTIILN